MSETAQAATARLEGTAAFAELLRQVRTLVDEARIEFTPEGIHVRAVDPPNVGAIDATMDAAAFFEYESDGATMGFNLHTLENVLDDEPQYKRGVLARNSEPKGVYTLEFDEAAEKLRLDAGMSTFRVDTIDPDYVREPHSEADVPWTTTVTLTRAEFATTVTHADEVAEKMHYGWDDDASEFYATAEGDTRDVNFSLEAGELQGVQADGDAHSRFLIDYLRGVKDAIPKSTVHVDVTIGEECPVLIEYDFADGLGHVEYMVAPRISGDDL